jgi:hypothetical protein
MTELPHDFQHPPPSPELIAAMEQMRARYQATGQANPPPDSPEARSPNRGWWRSFWASQARGTQDHRRSF